MPFPFDEYPWTKFEDLNIAYMINRLGLIISQAQVKLYELDAWKTATEQDLESWKNSTMDLIAEWEREFMADVNQWEHDTEQDLAQWKIDTTAALDVWKAGFITQYEALRVETEHIRDVANAAAQEATQAAASASADAASISASATQIQTNSDDIEDLKSALIKYNAYDALSGKLTTGPSTVVGGAHFVSNGDGTWTIFTDGAISANAYRNILLWSALPEGLTPGKTIFTRFECDNSNVFMLVNFRNASNVATYNRVGNEYAILTIPADAVEIAINIGVSAGANIPEADAATFTSFAILTNQTTNVTMQYGGILPNNADLNDYTDGARFYLLQSGYTYQHLPENMSTFGGMLEVFDMENITCHKITNFNPNGKNWHRFYVSSLNEWRAWIQNTNINAEIGYITPTGDATDRTAEIQAALENGYCRLAAGDYYVSGIDMPSFSCLCGDGNKTRIILIGSVTDGYAIKLGTYSIVRDLRIVGQTSNYTVKSNIGTRKAIVFTGAVNASDVITESTYRAIIDNVSISDFDGSGIFMRNTGGSWSASVSLSNIYINRCDAGIYIARYSEYHRFTNVSIGECYFGCINNGGNNEFVNCAFSGNKQGLLMDNSGGNSRNIGHGTFTACNFNHSDSNNGIAIELIGVSTGTVFNGCCIGYGEVIINNSPPQK